jgi:signal transduction histidine kinase
MKYGNAKNCYVILNSDSNVSSIKIIDDGMVYNFKEALATSSGTGLKNISSRLKTIDATIEQQKTTDGNHFIITLPLEKI